MQVKNFYKYTYYTIQIDKNSQLKEFYAKIRATRIFDAAKNEYT